MGRDMLVIGREALRALSEAAFIDINHLLRPAHLKQLRKILDDPEASDNDKFVAYDFLKNANIAAGGVLPMCQDTGTAIIMGKKGRMVFTAGDDEAALAEGARDAYLKRNLRYSQLSPNLDVRGKEHQVEHAGAGRDLCRRRGCLQALVHREGWRFGQQGVPLPGDPLDPDP
jgi:tartrate dehydratase alpha subunit/fumarate hydratase class I-like protein